jgi:Ser-tRNA(Ala) deacylase AlaX
VFKAAGSAATVFIEMDIKEEIIDVYVKSDSKDAKDVLHRYRVQILHTLEKLRIKPEEYMHVQSKGEVGKIKYTTVLNRYEQGKDVYVEDLNEDYDPAWLLGAYYNERDIAKSLQLPNSVNIGSLYLEGGSFMPENRIDVKADGGSSVNINAVQGSKNSTATQNVSINEPPQRVTEQQYAELAKLLNELTQSQDFKKLGMLKRRKLKEITKDSSHVSGWEKFRAFISDEANLTAIKTFAATYGPSLAAWIGKMLGIGA